MTPEHQTPSDDVALVACLTVFVAIPVLGLVSALMALVSRLF